MSNSAIEIEGIWKRYRLGSPSSGSLRESLSRLLVRKSKNHFWALKDLNLKINPGEAVGIIGKNGAGKSTLLKILSKITYPTKGRAIIEGRISSLLEVGTGFHPELTGKENVFLNGTILGMTRSEIKMKYDEIVAFSDVEKFIDTPIKYYSSGMKVRLAFSVAAHLEPEILIIDEVLAVGDSVFQKKCIEKMSEAASGGRTVLFVSHNMSAIRKLCTKSVLLKDGQIAMEGATSDVIMNYMTSNQSEVSKNVDLLSYPRSKWKQGIIFESISLSKSAIEPGESLSFEIRLKRDDLNYADLLFGLNVFDEFGNCIIHLSNIFKSIINISHKDSNLYKFTIHSLNLKPGRYSVNLFLRANEDIQDWLEGVTAFEVSEGNVYGFENSKMISGLIQPNFDFSIDEFKADHTSSYTAKG